jgi:hypothetical protein
MGAAQRIMTTIVPEWTTQFLDKNSDYNTASSTHGLAPVIEPADVLGVAGQFAEIWRKIWKLKKAMWDGNVLAFEQPREVLLDLIGHCFLAIDMLDRKAGMGKTIPLDFDDEIKPEDPLYRLVCGMDCSPRSHTFKGSCRYRRAGRNADPA